MLVTIVNRLLGIEYDSETYRSVEIQSTECASMDWSYFEPSQINFKHDAIRVMYTL